MPAKHTDDTIDAATEGVAHQPTLPALELPDYHGRKPVKMKTSLIGVGSRITRPHSIGDRAVLVLEVRTKFSGHEDTDDGLEYIEKHKVLDMFELAPEQGSRLIATIRSLYRTGEDAAKGRRPVPGLGEVGYTDGSGVALLPDEVAELRGDPVRAMLAPELTPAVIVYSDGARDLWPDDFPKDTPRPRIGETFVSDGGDVVVERLLHHETGEDLTAAETAPGARPLAAVPDLPPDPAAADPYAGDLADGASDEWETPDRRTAEQIAEDDRTAEIEAKLPTSADFALVDCDIDQLKGVASRVEDVATARRMVIAEEQGRGRKLKPRAGALVILRKRVEALEDAAHKAEMAARAEATS